MKAVEKTNKKNGARLFIDHGFRSHNRPLPFYLPQSRNWIRMDDSRLILKEK
jgi:hypothetical protein